MSLDQHPRQTSYDGALMSDGAMPEAARAFIRLQPPADRPK
jgi:hypothetical protein